MRTTVAILDYFLIVDWLEMCIEDQQSSRSKFPVREGNQKNVV